MITINRENVHIEGVSKVVLTELIAGIKELQKEYKKYGMEEMFKHIIRDCLEAKELERK